MSNDTRHDRRNVLKALGGAAGLGLVGGGAYLAIGFAAAQASINISITDSQISNDRGEVDWVGVDVDKTIQWDGFDVPVKHIGFKHEVATDANSEGWHTLYGEEVSPALPDWSDFGDDEAVPEYTTDEPSKPDGTKGEAQAGIVWEIINDGTYHDAFGYADGGPQDAAAWASDLSVPDDGQSATHEVRLKTTLRFYSGTDENGDYVPIPPEDGITEVSGEGRFDVTVTNEAGTTSGTTENGTSSGS